MDKAQRKALSSRPILIIEDSGEDYEALTRAFAKAGATNLFYRFSYGEDALGLLKRRGRFFDHDEESQPGMVLLDLNLPGATGHRVLQEIRADTHLATIPVIVLSSSSDLREIEACYKAGANCYVHKPASPDEFVKAILRLKEFWLDTAVLPPGPGGL